MYFFIYLYVTFMYILWIVIFLRFINTKVSNNHKLLSLSNLHSSTILTNLSLFWGKMNPPHFMKNKKKSNPIRFVKWERSSYD